MVQPRFVGSRLADFSKDIFDCLLISTHFTDLHFLEAATDSPITPAPEYRSTTVEPRGTYLFSLCSKELKRLQRKQALCNSKKAVQ
uniref:Uncharacterized protein n=1 Tax=Arundo donax TaxID=35708 RepID=A0A0A9CU52_ARUDO